MEKIVRTVCPRDCYDTCFVKAEVRDGKIIKVYADNVNPITSQFLCPRGNGDVKRVYSKFRILHPYIRHTKPCGALEKISWNDALDIVSSRIREVLRDYGSEAMLRLDYSGNMGLLSSLFSRRLWTYLGATQTDYTICSASGHTALKLHYGYSYGLYPDELINMKMIVFWGLNASISAPHIWHLAIKAREKDAILVGIDPIETKTLKKSDYIIRPRPGSDVSLAYGIMKILVEEEYIDKEFIEKYTYGFDRLVEKLNSLNSEYIEKITGVEWRRVKELARLYGENKPSATLIGFGMQKSKYGAEAVRAVSLIPALVGLHRGFYYSNSEAWFVDTKYLSGEKHRGKKRSIINQVSLGRLLEKGKFKLVFIYNTNPAQTLPNSSALRKGLSRKDVFVVVHETHWNETTDYADIILPAATYLEKDDVVISYSHRFVRLSRKAVNPLGESRDEIWVMRKIAEKIGIGDWVMEDPWRELDKAFEYAFEEGVFNDLKYRGIMRLKTKPREEYPTSSGKIEFYSISAEKLGYNGLPIQYPLENKFILITSSLPQYTHTQFQDVYGRIPPILWINPTDAVDIGIQSGDHIKIYNERGEVILKAVVTEKVGRKILWAPKLCNDIYGRPINILTPDEPQLIGNGSVFNSTIVELKKTEA